MTGTEKLVSDLKEAYANEENRRRLVYIPIDKLFPHPDNPRKDLGELSELTDSIIANGVMQNLTVIPSIKGTDEYNQMLDGKTKCSEAFRQHAINHAFTDEYTIIIGHRRHAAAVLAGVKELPCVVSDMDYPTQIATMMTENLQRADLTVYEQAQGFKQLSMDFGMSVERIAEKTGFSTSTVRRRLKMAELNQDTLKAVSGRQINMADFERLEKIDDEKLRDEALKEIGTANFNNQCARAEQEMAKRKRKAELQQMCLDAGLKEVSEAVGSKTEKYARVKAFYGSTPNPDELKDYAEQKEDLCFYVDRWNYIYLVSPKKEGKKSKEDERNEKEEARKAACAALDEAFERAYNLRYDFIKGFTDAKAKAKFPEIAAMLTLGVIEGNGGEFDEVAVDLLGGDVDQWNETDTTEECFLMMEGIVSNSPYLTTLVVAYLNFYDREKLNCRDYYAKYRKSKNLQQIYDRLCSLGYEMSDEEKALMDGSSDLYVKEEKDND